MKKVGCSFILALLIVILCGSSAYAINLGTNITIYDGAGNTNTWGGQQWYLPTQEDQEVEPGTVGGQQWDLEGFFQDNTTLSMVGGFDFINGEDDPYRPNHYDAGDIFVDVYGIENNPCGYDYALDLDFDTLSYSIYDLSGAMVKEVYFTQNSLSNPWRYLSGGTLLDGYSNLSLTYYSGLSDADVGGFLGGLHNVVQVELAFLAAGAEFTVHSTMGCGNDNLLGQGNMPAVPEPTSIFLFGSGLVALGIIRKKK